MSWSIFAAAVALGTVADGAAQDAQTLFDRGLEAMMAGRYESGCPDIERSYRVDPQPGALFTLAACYERWGKLHQATERYQQFMDVVRGLPGAQRTKQQARVAATREKMAELLPQVPKLELAFSEPPPPEVLVTLDGQSIPPAELGQERLVDPGQHEIEVRTPDGRVDRLTVTLEPGQARTVALQLPTAFDDEEPGAAADVDGGWTGLHTGAVVAGGLGLVGLVVGGVTGGMVFAKKGEVDDGCVDNVCTAEGWAAADDGKSLAMVSNVGFAVGGVALAGGVVLWLLAPSLGEPEQEAAGVRLDVGGVAGDPASATVGVLGSF